MKGGWLIIFILVISLVYAIAVQSQVNSEADELFGSNDEIGVIVILKDDYNVLQKYGTSNYDKNDFEMKKRMVSEQKELVLKDLKLKKKNKGISAQTNDDYDFDLTNSYTTVNGFAVKNILGKGSNIAVVSLILIAIIVSSFAGFKLYRRRQQKQQ